MRLILVSLLLFTCQLSFAQATYQTTGVDTDWTSTATWTLAPGSAADGDGVATPDANDNVILNHDVEFPGAGTYQCLALTANDGVTITYAGDGSSSVFLIIRGAFESNGAVEVTSAHNNNLFGLASSGSFTINSGSVFNVDRVRLSINRTAVLSGELRISQANTSTNDFRTIQVNSGGTWNNSSTQSFNVLGSLVNNSNNTFTGCSTNDGCTYAFTASGTSGISGSGNTELSRIVSNFTLNFNGTGGLTVTDDIDGVGTFNNNGDLTLTTHSGGANYTISTFDLNNTNTSVTFVGDADDVLDIGPFYDLTIDLDNSISLTTNQSISVENDLVINSGVLDIADDTFSVTGDVTISGGELSPNNTLAVLNVGGNVSLTSGTYDHNNGDVNITGAFSGTSGVFSLDGATSTFDANGLTIDGTTTTLTEGTLTVTGGNNLQVNSGSLVLSGSTLSISGSYNINGGTNDFNSGSFSSGTLDVGASEVLTVNSLDFAVAGSSNISGNVTFDGDSGNKSFDDITVNAGGDWNNNSLSDFTISGNITSNGDSWVGCSGNGCDYTLTSNSGSLSGNTAISFSDLIIDNPADYDLSNDLSVSDRITGTGSLTVGTNQTLTFSGSTFDILNFTASSAGSNLIYSVSGDIDLISTTDGAISNLTISNNSVGDDLTMTETVEILESLTLTRGNLIIGSFDLEVADGASILDGSDESYIVDSNAGGTIVQAYPIGGNNTTLNLQMGSSVSYAPMSFTLNSATIVVPTELAFNFDEDNPNGHPDKANNNLAAGGDDDGTAANHFLHGWWTFTVKSGAISDENFTASIDYTETGFSGTESSLAPVLLRTATPPAGSSTIDWFEVGVQADFGDVSVDQTNDVISFLNVNNVENTSDSYVLYAMDNLLDRLPVVLLSFSGSVMNNSVLLKWETASEENNNQFEIERSADGKVFQTIGSVKGQGNSDSLNEYSFIDQFPLRGRSFYRLKQVDFNGQFEYSEVLQVNFTTFSGQSELKVYPNPAEAGQNVVLELSDSGSGLQQIQITDNKGQVVWLGSFDDSGRVELGLPVLARGVYLIRVLGSSTQKVKKLLIH